MMWLLYIITLTYMDRDAMSEKDADMILALDDSESYCEIIEKLNKKTILTALLIFSLFLYTPASAKEFTQFVPYNGKIADITHADTDLHTITLTSLGLPNNTVAINLQAFRMSGTGDFYAYPNEGAMQINLFQAAYKSSELIGLKNATYRMQYKLSVAGSDWDLYCSGYFVSVEEQASTATTTYTNGGSYILMVAIVLIVLVVAGGMRKR